MSQRQTSAIEALFDMQRTAVEGTQQLFHRTMDATTDANRAMVRGIETADSAREGTTGLTKSAVDAYVDAMQASVPGDLQGLEQFRTTLHEQVDAADEMNADAWESFDELVERNTEAFESFADDYTSMVDDGFDAFLEAHEGLRSSTVEATEQVEESLES